MCKESGEREREIMNLLLIEVLLLITLIRVEAEFNADTSVQFTSVPFKPSLTGSITSRVVSDRLPAAEILKKVNLIKFTSKSDITDSEDKTREYFLAVVSPSGITMKLHSINDSLTGVVQVNSSMSPLHTGAVPEGDIVTPFIIIL